jgi:hypothetical protein
MVEKISRCVYKNCPRGCISICQHRALYASFARERLISEYKPSVLINRERLLEWEDKWILDQNKIEKIKKKYIK